MISNDNVYAEIERKSHLFRSGYTAIASNDKVGNMFVYNLRQSFRIKSVPVAYAIRYMSVNVKPARRQKQR